MRRAAISIVMGQILTPLPRKVRPGDLGIDAMHINLHKTFSTPHGGGGPGVGGRRFYLKRLSPFAPRAFCRRRWMTAMHLARNPQSSQGGRRGRGKFRAHDRFSWPDGHVCARSFLHDEPRAPMAFKQAAEDAVLNANYMCRRA